MRPLKAVNPAAPRKSFPTMLISSTAQMMQKIAASHSEPTVRLVMRFRLSAPLTSPRFRKTHIGHASTIQTRVPMPIVPRKSVPTPLTKPLEVAVVSTYW